MQNKPSDPTNALNQVEPKTKSARIKAMHGLIESKIQAGVNIAQIVDALNASGLDINVVTLKSYLYRLRKKKTPTLPAAQPTGQPVSDTSNLAEASAGLATGFALSEIDSIINQDPASQAQDIAMYERLAKSTRRKP